ncbi:MAG: hypothetical protein FWH27_00175 [Planctomycetaceae bacterium]|nr:hypothetical protein [Planctomycetaceae bacterium]
MEQRRHDGRQKLPNALQAA